jgi:hypothetical protein
VSSKGQIFVASGIGTAGVLDWMARAQMSILLNNIRWLRVAVFTGASYVLLPVQTTGDTSIAIDTGRYLPKRHSTRKLHHRMRENDHSHGKGKRYLLWQNMPQFVLSD